MVLLGLLMIGYATLSTHISSAVFSGAAANPANALALLTLDTPTALAVTAGNASAAATWSAPAANAGAVTGYLVSAAPVSGGTTQTCTSIAPTTSCTVTGLINSTVYAVSVMATVGGWTGPASSAINVIPAAVVAYESFTGVNGAAILNTTTDSGGFTWTAHSGTWSVQSNEARSTSVGSGYLLFNNTSNDGSVQATVSRNGNATWDTYVIFNSDSTFSNTLLANWWHNAGGSIDLYKGVSGSYTPLVSISGLYPGTIPASAVIRIESPSTSVIKVYLDNVLKITYTLSSTEQTQLKNSTHRYVGIGANADAASTFDDFYLYS